jgi:hypothetical protein
MPRCCKGRRIVSPARVLPRAASSAFSGANRQPIAVSWCSPRSSPPCCIPWGRSRAKPSAWSSSTVHSEGAGSNRFVQAGGLRARLCRAIISWRAEMMTLVSAVIRSTAYRVIKTFAGPSHLTESGELECLAIESRGHAAAQSAIACVDQTISEIGGGALPQVNRFFYGRLILKCEFCSVQ